MERQRRFPIGTRIEMREGTQFIILPTPPHRSIGIDNVRGGINRNRPLAGDVSADRLRVEKPVER